MTTQIVVHVLPHEIDWFEWQIRQLKQGSYYLEEDDNIVIDVTLNLNLTDWSKSQLPKQFFIDKFNQIKMLCDWCQPQFIVDEENKCLGCGDKRQQAVSTSKSDNILYLDTDLIFSPYSLKYIIEAAKSIDHEYYIISPQTVRMWDSSWDVLVNQKYLNTPTDMKIYYGNDPFEVIFNNQDNVSLRPIEAFKFGGGWFNLLSTKLLQLTDIPDGINPYGPDDTYVMICCDIMKQKGYNVQQYVLDGLVVIENFKYRWNPYKDFLYLIDNQAQYRKQAEDNLQKELQNFINKV
jgi:hypothetical protein